MASPLSLMNFVLPPQPLIQIVSPMESRKPVDFPLLVEGEPGLRKRYGDQADPAYLSELTTSRKRIFFALACTRCPTSTSLPTCARQNSHVAFITTKCHMAVIDGDAQNRCPPPLAPTGPCLGNKTRLWNINHLYTSPLAPSHPQVRNLLPAALSQYPIHPNRPGLMFPYCQNRILHGSIHAEPRK